ncbi:hypothetical protein CEXT_3291 [Caerostris extrusa]|uniref:Uncharacterized protein n=1 Tax=Caerostris extrusa TaxID=172846 RepID=A0AAV4SFF6_CAEEX|nr:hypothetical protein CEXT_3291 [Caerostris extrusa]
MGFGKRSRGLFERAPSSGSGAMQQTLVNSAVSHQSVTSSNVAMGCRSDPSPLPSPPSHQFVSPPNVSRQISRTAAVGRTPKKYSNGKRRSESTETAN